jgi:ATP-dependent RNA helicase DeaD
MIVGALANEGGLRRADFGKITLGIDHAVVELPQDLPPAVFEALADTRISGRRIDLQADRGARGGRSSRDDRPTAHRKGSGAPGGKGKGGQRGSWSKDGESPRKPRHPKGH